MLNAILVFSLKQRYLVLTLALLLCCYGGFAFTELPIDVFRI